MKNTILVILAGCLAVGMAQASSDKSTAKGKKEEVKESKGRATPTAVQSATQDPAYKIGPQDVLKIDVWREDQLTRTVPVRPDGKITLPLLNDVQAAGVTPMDLAGVIRHELKNYINKPQLTFTMTEINNRRTYLTAE